MEEQPEYLVMERLLSMIQDANQSKCLQLLNDEIELFQIARGSAHNHQYWSGGYFDHILEVLNIAKVLYEAYSQCRPLPFSLSDAITVLFLHDIEKPWKYEQDKETGKWRHISEMMTEEQSHVFRDKKIAEYDIQLSPEQQNALKYVHGEGDDYSSKQRTMNSLAAFCHICDISSARIWFDHPMQDNDPWGGACRIRD